jgi:DNA-binding transcriptional LysR family regulator
VLCAAPAYLKQKGVLREPADLARHDLVSTPIQKGSRLAIRLRHQGKQSEVAVTPHIQSESFLFLKNAVLEGIGLGVLPYYAVRDELDSGTLVPVLPKYTVDVWGDRLFMITAPNLYPTLAARSLIEFLKVQVAHLPFMRTPS